MNSYPLIRSLLFRFNPETAHQLTLGLMRLAGDFTPVNILLRKIYAAPAHPVQAFGLRFKNPLGLAAGYDKDGLGWRGLACLGFGHIEVGTVTPRSQPGNARPRLFRMPAEHALINRMGFPGKGAEFVRQKISTPRPKNLVLGVNIGMNKDTPLEQAVQDYLYLLQVLYLYADYLTINVSSPNTQGLRQLQGRQQLDSLLSQLSQAREQIKKVDTLPIPILVKLAPDLTDAELEEALDVILANHMDGVIATNTTLSRLGINTKLASEQGGLSGRPLFNLSLSMVKKIHSFTGGQLPIIGVGGVDDITGVQKMMDAGALLVQIYTGLVYEGPGLVRKILAALPDT